MPRFDHVSGKHLQIEDARIYVEETGDPAGQPLVLLHGGLGHMADFNILLDLFTTPFRFIGIDLRGHGKSTLGSARLTYAQHQHDVEAVLAHLGIDQFSLLGFSDGGIVGYRMAAQSPTRVQKILTLGAQWRLKEDDPSIAYLQGLTADMWEEMFPDSVSFYKEVNPKPDFERLIASVVDLWLDRRDSGYPQESVRNIKVPLLIARGDDDHLFSLSEAVELHHRVKGSRFLNIPFAGHTAHWDATDMFMLVANQIFNPA